jgi:hypothetical protein
MRLLASHTVTHLGEEKSISLYQGDLTKIPQSEAVDLLLVSAFPNDYIPTPSSLIGALDRIGVSVEDLSLRKEIDLRHPLSAWLTHDIAQSHPNVGFRRILCFETIEDKSPPEAIGDVFRAILPFALADPPIRSIAMPVLASGDQRYDETVMFTAIFEAATHWLAAGLPMNKIKIVVHKEAMAMRLQTLFTELSQRQVSQLESVKERACDTDAPYHFFISYAHKDTVEVDLLLEQLLSRKPSLRVFRDKLRLDVGQSWQSELDTALENCQHVIAVYSPAYLKSKMCLEEFNMARLRHRESPTPVLTPVYLRETPLPLYMRTLQFIDCREANPALLAAAADHLGAVG